MDEIHDRSRVDGYARNRQRVAFLSAVWRPMLAGAVGAALVIGAVAIAQPRFVYRDVEIPRVTMRDVTADHVIPRDVEVDHVVPHDVPVEIPRIIVAPADRPLTSDETRFASRPEYQDAPYHGRIVASRGGGALSFADGKDFFPAHWDAATSQSVLDPERAFASEAFIGDLGMCRQDPDDRLWICVAFHNGRETPIVHKRGRAA
jgi:hypothetical protein